MWRLAKLVQAVAVSVAAGLMCLFWLWRHRPFARRWSKAYLPLSLILGLCILLTRGQKKS